MSALVTGLAFAPRIGRTPKLVLLALADHADHNGENAYPSVGLLAWKTSLCERSVRYALDQLVAQGWIACTAEAFTVKDEKGLRRTNTYAFNMEALKAAENERNNPARRAGSNPARRAGSNPAKTASEPCKNDAGTLQGGAAQPNNHPSQSDATGRDACAAEARIAPGVAEELANAWRATLAGMAEREGLAVVRSWLLELVLEGREGQAIVFTAKSRFVADTVRSRFSERIAKGMRSKVVIKGPA